MVVVDVSNRVATGNKAGAGLIPDCLAPQASIVEL